MRRRVALFALSSLLAGFGALLGSIAGHALGPRGLLGGGVLGGLLGASCSAVVANRFKWLRADRVRHAALGACAGFIVAALIATHTLNSPVGPILSTLLVGLGATLGAGQHHDPVTS